MKIIRKDLKHGFAKVRIQNLDDLWYLSHIVEPGDLVSGTTVRKIKSGGEEDRAVKTHTRKMYLKISAEKVEFHKYSDTLRVSGKIVDGPDDVSRGTYHTFSLEPTVEIGIEKERWLKYQVDKLAESAKNKGLRVLLCLFEREHAIFAELKSYGYEMLSEIKGKVQKKDSPEKVKSAFFSDIVEALKEYDSKGGYSSIVLASPAFWKEYLMQKIEDEGLKKKLIAASCNSVNIDGINEVLRRPEVLTALKEDRVVREISAVEEVLARIGKKGPVSYGVKQTEQAASAGAVEHLVVTDSLMQRFREEGSYEAIDRLMKKVDDMKGEITIVSSEHIGGQKLDGIGGIAALLRYDMG